MLNTTRHDNYFDKKTFVLPVHLIGCGGVGSHIGELLAKLGIGTTDTNLVNLWDGDEVAVHNIANQAFEIEHIGRPKAECLKEEYKRWSGGIDVVAHTQFVKEKIALVGVVILAVDSMAARKQICRESVWNNKAVKLLIEIRMDASYIIVHTLDPNNQKHIDIWEEEWYPDGETENTMGCGGHISIITTVFMAAALAINKLVTFHRHEELSNKLTFDIKKGVLKEYFW